MPRSVIAIEADAVGRSVDVLGQGGEDAFGFLHARGEQFGLACTPVCGRSKGLKRKSRDRFGEVLQHFLNALYGPGLEVFKDLEIESNMLDGRPSDTRPGLEDLRFGFFLKQGKAVDDWDG